MEGRVHCRRENGSPWNTPRLLIDWYHSHFLHYRCCCLVWSLSLVALHFCCVLIPLYPIPKTVLLQSATRATPPLIPNKSLFVICELCVLLTVTRSGICMWLVRITFLLNYDQHPKPGHPSRPASLYVQLPLAYEDFHPAVSRILEPNNRKSFAPE